MDRTYWDKKSKTYNTEIFDVNKNDKTRIIEACINEVASPKKTVADFGCAIGKWLPLLSPKFKSVLAVDYSLPLLQEAEKRYKALTNVQYKNIDLMRDMKEAYAFDVVLCVNAILTDVYAKRAIFFNNLAKSIKKNGHLILVIPSLESALYSEFMIDDCNRKRDLSSSKKIKSTSAKTDNSRLHLGIVALDKVPHKHYLKEELIITLGSYGFKTEKVEKVEYTWRTEIANAPKSLPAPYPWDWVVVAKKVR
jgi:2-polyprenyl-3-methyl-5-hydroxy-6-metoxy-1,4-benzoquinol methylase